MPVIMLTAKGEDMDKILGLDYGADDYMTKPFNILELRRRLSAVFRRSTMPATATNRLSRCEIWKSICPTGMSSLMAKEVNLTAKEFDLLQLFASNPGKVYSRESLLEIVWKYDYLEI